MSQDLDTRPELEQTTELRRRGPLAWLVAAAAVAVIAGGGYAAVSSMQDNGTVQQAGPSTAPVEPVDEPTVVTLQAPTAVVRQVRGPDARASRGCRGRVRRDGHRHRRRRRDADAHGDVRR